MAALTLLPALMLGALGLVLISGILAVLLRASVGDWRALWEGGRIKRRERILLQCDEALAKGDFDAIRRDLRQAFFFDIVSSSSAIVERLNHHHFAVLGRIVAVAEKRAGHLSNLAVVEDLLQTRSFLLRTHLEAFQSIRQIRRKSRFGKKTPEWAMQEFEKKLIETLDRLKTNRQSLITQLDDLFKGLGDLPSEDQVTYH